MMPIWPLLICQKDNKPKAKPNGRGAAEPKDSEPPALKKPRVRGQTAKEAVSAGEDGASAAVGAAAVGDDKKAHLLELFKNVKNLAAGAAKSGGDGEPDEDELSNDDDGDGEG